MKESKIFYFDTVDELNSYLSNNFSKDDSIIFVDSNVSSEYKFDENFNTHEILVNEETKNITTVEKIWEIMHSNSVTRSTNVICIGGGVLCDVVGFATSTYKRGANLVLIPTTLLAMVDASHGGKNGVNNNYGKNQIGTFYLPNEVLVCIEFLNSLNKEEINTGLIEVIKAGFIGNSKILELVYGDDSLYSDKSLLQLAIDVKTKITNEDLKESNTRMYLNFGHTIGHLIESDSNYQISHGQAVGIGILIALEISEKEYNLDQSYRKNYMTFLNNSGLKSHYKFQKTRSELITILSNDKKVNNEKINFVLLEEIEKPILKEIDIEQAMKLIINE
ncbi:MAG: 3-dehydroquinate synthase family protein [Candidatus Actinomarina sp.]